MLNSSSWVWKLLIAAGLLLGTYLGGFWVGRGNQEIQTVEKVVLKEGRETIVYRDRIVTKTIIRRPDGTVEETEKVEESQKDTTKESEEVARERDEQIRSTYSDYSVGAKYWFRTGNEAEFRNVELTVGRRLLGEVWAEVGVRGDLQLNTGLSINF